MIPFFRKIRYNLTQNDQFYKYLKYAIGEILLVVLGILIALQINNWNDKRKNDILFQESMEQIYNGLKTDTDRFNGILQGLEFQVEKIDDILDNSDSIDKYERPYALHDVVYDFIQVNTETEYFSQRLIYNPHNRKQRSLAKRLADYLLRVRSFTSDIDVDLNTLLGEKGLPRYNFFQTGLVDSTYYSEEHMALASELIQDEYIRNKLKSIKIRTLVDIGSIKNFETEAKSIMAKIRLFYPDVRIKFENVGIIGTALEGWDDVAISTPMVETEHSIFERELFLNEGEVKFRSNDSWIKNWGGDTFPDGEAIHDGNNIHVDESGKYLIRLDLNSNTYSFIKVH
jgi:hypothetical protein